MPVISKISPQVKRQGYYNIYIDGKYELSLSELDLASSGIKTNQNIDEKKLKELKSTQAKSKSYNFAIRYLALRPRSSHEVSEYLIYRKGFTQEEAEYTIHRLTNEKYINDQDFAEMWVRNRMLLSPKSERVLRLELIKKGVDKQLIDNVLVSLSEQDMLDSIIEVINKKLRQQKFRDKQKLTESLSRQGYNYGLIKKAFEELTLFQD
jgi:regulatory protein